MDIVMPAKYTDESNRTLAPESRSTTLLLGDNHQVYYYWGIPKLDDPSVLKETDLKNGGLRNIF